MFIFADHPELFNQVLHFDPVAVKAEDIIRKFFKDYRLSEIRDILWFWFVAAITAENDQYSDASGRADLLQAYQQIEELIEAAYLLYLQYEKIE